MSAIEIDQPVADFECTATSDRTIRLSELKGRNLVIYFYPKDNTPGCTTEGRDFQDALAEFDQANTTIFGVSRDSLKSHESFRAKQGFEFDLISDPDEVLCKSFDVIRLKKMYGRETLGVERSTFLIDGAGILRKAWRKVRVKGHVAEVLEAAQGLG